MKNETKYAFVGVGVALGGIVTVSAVTSLITKRLLKLAMDRKEPKSIVKNKAKLTRSGDMNLFLEAVAKADKKLRECNSETVEICSHDGVRLVGHWRMPSDPKRVIIAMHGWRSSWAQDFGSISDFWYDNDCAVLYAEQRGHGNSGGEYLGFGMLERHDCLGWINWVNEKTDMSLPVYLGGVSMGATTVLMTAGLDLPDNVKGIVADCGFTSPQAIWKHVVEKKFHMPYSLHASTASELCRKRINMTSHEYSAVDAMKVCKIPILFIHGTDDKFVPINMTYENYKACVAPKRIMVVPGAGHGMSYFTDKQGYESEIKEFWNKYDFCKI